MPTVEEALQLGWKQHQAGNVRGAEQIYRQVLAVAPGNENAWCFLGMACHDQGRLEEAGLAYQEALRIRPAFPVALSNYGNTLKQQGRLDEAEARCREALKYKPDYSTAYNNLGVVLVAKGQLAEAGETFEQSLRLVPNDVVAQANLGAALIRQGKFVEGTSLSERALRINPNYAEAQKNLAIVRLLRGDFARGWSDYEWRWRCPGSRLPNVAGPRWNGEELAGKTLLLHWEQGLGDTLQFVRYARLLRRRGARIVVCCQKPLRKLLERCEGIDELVAADEPLPRFDSWTPLLSIPHILHTTLDSIPGEVGYLSADPARVREWQGRLTTLSGWKVGIVWQGSPDFHADRQRSIPLSQFEPLSRIPGVSLVSLQKGAGTEQLPGVAGRFAVHTLPADFDEGAGPFVDTAAVLQNLDLLVASDTSVPHLAGALGVPTWLALSVSPDWRWLLERDDSPWYPSMRLVRQRSFGDWAEVFARIASEVSRWLAQRSVRSPVHLLSPTTTSGSPNMAATLQSPSRAQTITVEIAPGELIDKITILEIKVERITQPEKLRNVQIELNTLTECRDQALPSSSELDSLTAELKKVNESLWVIEDEIRDCERQRDFGTKFIELARSVYISNDRRAAVKRQINELLGSRLIEEKSYAAY